MEFRKTDFDEFVETVRSVNFEEYGTFRITQIEGKPEKFSIQCEIVIDEEPGFQRLWSITVSGAKKTSLRLGYFDNISFDENHILLAEFSQPIFRLGFRGKPNDSFSVVGRLYNSHRKIAADWIPFSAYFMGREITTLIDAGFGTLAEGPAQFIHVYNQVLQDCEIQTSITGERDPTEWNGMSFEPFAKLSVLTLDDSFIAAERFDAYKN